MIRYCVPPDVLKTILAGRPVLSTAQGGKIALDETVLSLWQLAKGRDLSEIVTQFNSGKLSTKTSTPTTTRAALACLAEAGLLIRDLLPEPRTTRSSTGPLISVIIVGHNSREWLDVCLTSLFSQTYSPLEILYVDNASADSSADWVGTQYPQVKLLRCKEVQPLARAINQGVEAAGGHYFLTLNPDVRLETDAVAQMFAVAQKEGTCAAVAGKLKFTWAPAFLNGLGNFVGPFSWGTDIGLGHLDLGQFDSWETVPSACFAAALIQREAWEAVGPLDEGFPMYYEDSEWSYRARLLGYTIRAAPRAVIYHAFGEHVPGREEKLSPRKLRNVTYGRLRFATKIAGRSLGHFLLSYLLTDLFGALNSTLRLDGSKIRAYLGAWRDFWTHLPEIRRERKMLHARRSCSDKELFALQKTVPAPLIWNGLPELTWDLVIHQYLPLLTSYRTRPMPEFNEAKARPRLLIISNDIVDTRMAGPGMRYLEMAKALSDDLDVTLAIPSKTSLDVPGVILVQYRHEKPDQLRVLVERQDVVLVSSYIVEKFPFLERINQRLVVDLYDPFVLENLHYYLDEPMEIQEGLNEHGIDITNRLAKTGDFFICGSERQRDYWMGVLTANGRTNPRTYHQDNTLRSLIDVVGIGFPDRNPNARPMIREIHPQVPPGARIVLWGGGIWNWLDPLTLVKAWPQVIAAHPEARLIFLGTRHPNPLVPRHEMAEKTELLADEIGEKDRTILFFEWLPYEDREALLCEADIGVMLHPIHVETRYSTRTRVLDYLWARLPVLITGGDVTSQWICQYQIGMVVSPSDVNAVAQGLCTLLEKPKVTWTEAFEPLHKLYIWPRVVEPLLRYCQEGQPAPDRLPGEIRRSKSTYLNTWRWRRGRAMYILRHEGVKVLIHRFWRYAQWRLSQPFGK